MTSVMNPISGPSESLAVFAENYGARGDGTGATIASAFGTLAAAQAVYPFVTSLANTWDFVGITLALQAISAAGGGVLRLLPGHTYVADGIQPVSNLTIDGAGATLQLTTGQLNLIIDQARLGLSNIIIRHVNFVGPGTGSTATAAMQFRISTNIQVVDCVFSGFQSAFHQQNCVQVLFHGNLAVNCGGSAGYNIVDNYCDNTAVGGSSPGSSHELTFTDNQLIGVVHGHGIGLVANATAATGFSNVVVAGNLITCVSGIPIELENAGGFPCDSISITGNVCLYTGGGAPTNLRGIYLNSAANPTNPLTHTRVNITGNTCRGFQIGVDASPLADSVIANNELDSTDQGVNVASAGGTLSATGTTTNASTSVTGVVAPAGVVNGMAISGTGIPANTYLVSGAGTSTWTMSRAATGANTGLTLSPVCMRVTVAHNVCHIGIVPISGPPGIALNTMRDSAVIGNLVEYDPGAPATGNTNAFGIQLTSCGWCKVQDNTVTFAPQHGIKINACNDTQTIGNTVLRPGEATVQGGSTGTKAGINLVNWVGNMITRANVITDDRAAPVMDYGIKSNITGALTTGNVVVGSQVAVTTNTTAATTV